MIVVPWHLGRMTGAQWKLTICADVKLYFFCFNQLSMMELVVVDKFLELMGSYRSRASNARPPVLREPFVVAQVAQVLHWCSFGFLI